MSTCQRLAAASLVAAAALAVAACGPPPGPAPTPTQQVTSGGTAPQGNGNYPYEPGGVTYTGGVGGAVELFSIPAGAYSLNQQATYNPVYDPDGGGTCLFGGELDYLSGGGGSIPLGDNAVPISSWDPIEGPPTKATYPAGNYKLYIYPETTCSWTVELWP
jgi:hypothetical protein